MALVRIWRQGVRIEGIWSMGKTLSAVPMEYGCQNSISEVRWQAGCWQEILAVPAQHGASGHEGLISGMALLRAVLRQALNFYKMMAKPSSQGRFGPHKVVLGAVHQGFRLDMVGHLLGQMAYRHSHVGQDKNQRSAGWEGWSDGTVLVRVMLDKHRR
jgi:hypothetical protein